MIIKLIDVLWILVIIVLYSSMFMFVLTIIKDKIKGEI